MKYSARSKRCFSTLVIAALCAAGSTAIVVQPVSAMSDEMELSLLYKGDFSDAVNLPEKWVVEQQEGGSVEQRNGRLKIFSPRGTTVWFKEKLPENALVEFDVTMLKSDSKHERGSDMNFFISANDSESEDFFAESDQRGGIMPNYLGMSLYYVGLGVHNNTKARMRRYPGDGTKPLLPEHDLSGDEYLNRPNQLMTVRVASTCDGIKVWRDGQSIFDFNDEHPLGAGYFGFRTWSSHLHLENVRIYQMNESNISCTWKGESVALSPMI